MNSIYDQGYDFELVEDPPERLKCSICKRIMKKPIQTCRGEIACNSCYYSQKGIPYENPWEIPWIAQCYRDNNICPIDNEPIAANEIYPDRAKEREILAFRCYCKYKNSGCNWNGTIKTHPAHIEICRYRPVECMFCSETFAQDALEEHLQQCIAVNQSKECPYAMFGCNFIPNAEEDMAMHMQKNLYLHTSMFMKAYQQLKTGSQETQTKMGKLQHQVDTTNKNSAQLVLKVVELEETNKQLSNTVKTLEQNQSKILARMTKLETSKNKSSPDNVSETESSSTKAGSSIHKEEIGDKLEKTQSEVRQLSSTITNISQNLSDVDLRHQLHENTTYNGTMVWKIDNYDQRFNLAKIGKTTALHSAPAFTDKYGYKFCARLYLNGDGMGKNTHMSLFFVLMKSEFDNLLQWPFTKHVSFTLLNQENSELNIKETFHADVNSSSFKKPVKQMNVASGCPFFVQQDKLRKPGAGFIKDNCFFLEIKVK